MSNQLLEGAGILGEVSIGEWPLFFVPLADDVLSLELDDATSDLYLVGIKIAKNSALLIFVEKRSDHNLPRCKSTDATTTEVWTLSPDFRKRRQRQTPG